MSEQRIDSAAAAATSTEADPGEGTGLATPGAHHGGGAGGTDDMAVPDDQERLPVDETPDGETEGERSVRAASANRPDDAPVGGAE